MKEMKILGKRSSRKPPGLKNLEAFFHLLDRLRSVQIARPHGLFRFRTFEEAQRWWEETRHPLRRDPRRLRTSSGSAPH